MAYNLHPCLWFNGNGAAAADFYCTVFKDAKVTFRSDMVVNFELAGCKFMALNGGPHFTPNPSISFYVICPTANECQETWNKISEGGTVMMAFGSWPWSSHYGWCIDKFGIAWQITLGQKEDLGQVITTALMFVGTQNGNAQKAIDKYTSIFEKSRVNLIAKYEDSDGDVIGNIKHAQFFLDGTLFMAMDSSINHTFGFNEAISIVAECESQSEIDHLWDSLIADGGQESMCGWLKDSFGVSWQIVPKEMGLLMAHPEKAARVMEKVMKMRKLDLKILQDA